MSGTKSGNISAIKAGEKEIEIVHPDTEAGLGIFVTVMSLDDERLKAKKNALTREALQLQSRGKTYKPEQIEDNRRSLAFAAMVKWRWEGDANFNGEVPDLTKDNAFKIFEELPWFLRQVQDGVDDQKGFFR